MTTMDQRSQPVPSDTSEKPEQTTKAIYIAGSGRNGSTLLGMCLATHPDAFFAGELTHIWKRGYLDNQLCGCGSPFQECQFWQTVTHKAFGSINDAQIREIQAVRDKLSSFRRIARLLRGKRLDPGIAAEYGAVYFKLVQAIANVSGKTHVIDSSKYPTDMEAVLACKQLDTSVIHLVRNCNAVAYSWKKRKKRPEIHWKDQDMPRYSTAKTALAWRLFNSLTTKLAGGTDSRYRLIRYESLVADFPNSIHDIVAWLGLTKSEIKQSNINPHNVSGNPCRFNFDSGHVHIDEEWKQQFGKLDRTVVQLICGRMQQSFGYGGGEG